MSENELRHYGVVGMKWGIRKDPTKAYERASKKLSKLDKKVTKREEKALRKRDRYDTLQSRLFASKERRDKAKEKARRASIKLNKQVKRAQDWYNAMDAAFKETSISLTKEQVAMGKKYARMRTSRAMSL